jgi:hypothetical protein
MDPYQCNVLYCTITENLPQVGETEDKEIKIKVKKYKK